MKLNSNVSFNTECTFFVISNNTGYQIYNSKTLECRSNTKLYPLLQAHLLNTSNLLALVPLQYQTKVVLYDDLKQSIFAEIEYKNKIKNVKMYNNEGFVVLFETMAFLYTIIINHSEQIQHKHTFSNTINPFGLVAISHKNRMMAIPARNKGQVQLVNLKSLSSSLIVAHKSNLACLSLNDDGSLLATASEQGTLIRLFNTQSSTLQAEFRRGLSDTADIHCINFDAFRIVCTSDKDTVHIFNIYNDNNTSASSSSKKSTTTTNRYLLPLSYNASFAKFIIKNTSRSICAFVELSNGRPGVVVVYFDGSAYHVSFNPNSPDTNDDNNNSYKNTQQQHAGACRKEIFKILHP